MNETEIDRLKAELEREREGYKRLMDDVTKLHAQIAEARAELSFWRAMDKDLATGESIKDKIRQDVAREIIQYVIDQGQIPTGWNQTMLYEIDDSDIIELKSLFKLEG